MAQAMQRLNRVTGHLTQYATARQISADECTAFDRVTQAPPDAILGVKTAFLADKDPRKMNLGIGAYRGDDGKPYVLNCVRKAEQKILSNTSLDKEYLSQSGDVEFCKLAREALLGPKNPACLQKRVSTAQTLSGTGSLRVMAAFIQRFLPGRTVHYSDPTWGNHIQIMDDAGVKHAKYAYWSEANRNLNFDGLIADLNKAKTGDIILLHACAHNPTGVDPTKEQWKKIAEVMKQKQLLPWFDSAYQGFASGSLEEDAWAIRYFCDQGFEMLVCQSFAKNFGLYGERIGTCSVVCDNPAKVPQLDSQLDLLIRTLYSNPPLHGMRIVKTILGDSSLTAMWQQEMVMMSSRINEMRQVLRAELERLKTPGDWSHITTQIGMFSYTGLSKAQCQKLISKWHVFLLLSGRISMAGINSQNVAYLAQAINDVVVSDK